MSKVVCHPISLEKAIDLGLRPVQIIHAFNDGNLLLCRESYKMMTSIAADRLINPSLEAEPFSWSVECVGLASYIRDLYNENASSEANYGFNDKYFQYIAFANLSRAKLCLSRRSALINLDFGCVSRSSGVNIVTPTQLMQEINELDY